jgi:fructose-bisphosphate aldolase, class II
MHPLRRHREEEGGEEYQVEGGNARQIAEWEKGQAKEPENEVERPQKRVADLSGRGGTGCRSHDLKVSGQGADCQSANPTDYLQVERARLEAMVPIATPETYRAMLTAARQGGFAYPAINVTSSSTLLAALEGFSAAGSDGIAQISYGGGEFASGQSNKDMALGAQALAEFANVVAPRYPVNIALHTDHCPPDRVDGFIRPLLEVTRRRRDAGLPPLFQSHMLDASILPMEENLALAAELLAECSEVDVILELEIGIVGGVEDATDHEGVDRSKMYTSPEDMVRVSQVLGTFDKGLYLLAAVFGNVHGVYKPGAVKLDPKILRDGQAEVERQFGRPARHYLVFHGGSGSSIEEIRETIDYGVIKMNIDTDCQYAYTRPIVDHVMTNYTGVLKVDGEVGDKKVYDPRSYMKRAELGMASRVTEACGVLGSAGRTLG